MPSASASKPMLSPWERAIVCAAADTFFPSGGPIPLSGSQAGAADYFETYLHRSQRYQRFLLHLLFFFTELGPLVFGPRRARLTRLGHEDRLRYLHGAFASRIYFRRVSFVSLRAIMTMAYLANDEVARCMRMEAHTDPFGVGARAEEPRPALAMGV